MAGQFMRRAELLISNDNQGIDLSELHFRFNVKQATLECPQQANIRVYNLSPETVERIAAREFTRVRLQAGYQNGNYGTIFDGTVIQPRIGRESATDTFVDLIAAEADEFFNSAWLNLSLARGTAQKDILSMAMSSMLDQTGDLTLSVVAATETAADMESVKLPRGKVMYGMARNYFHAIAASSGYGYFVDKGEIVFVPLDGFRPGEAVAINARTGMINWPIQTQDGIEFTCLLNPLLSPGSQVKLDNASILQAQHQAFYGMDAQQLIQQSDFASWALPQLDNDGLYRIFVLEHEGDTRGNEWYSKVVCLSIDPSKARLTSLQTKGQF